jgi:hypothetical protein
LRQPKGRKIERSGIAAGAALCPDNILNTEPSEIVAGDAVKWKKSLADYPAGEWTLNYRCSVAPEQVYLRRHYKC